MAFDPDEAFKFMRCMYRNGVFEKFTAIQGEAMDEVMTDARLNIGDLMNRMDQATDASIARIDRMLGTMGPLFKYLANDRLMRFLSKTLDVSFVRRQVLKNMKKTMLQALTGHAAAQVVGTGTRVRA
jgi:hypothetical protein